MSSILHFHNLFFSLMLVLLFVLSDISLILHLSHLLFAHLTLCIVWHMSIWCWSHLVSVYLMLVYLMLVCLMFIASDLGLILRRCVLYVTHLTKISYYALCVKLNKPSYQDTTLSTKCFWKSKLSWFMVLWQPIMLYPPQLS